MAGIYERPPLFKQQRTWNEKTILPEVYKLTSPNPRNKNKAEIHKDSGLYGIEFTIDKTIPDFNKGADKVELDYATAFIEFQNVLEGALNSAWKYVLKEHFPEPIDDSTGILLLEFNRNSKENFQRAIELFLQHGAHEKKLRDRQLIYYQPGGDFQVQKDLGTSVIEHPHRFEELLRVAELLPAGDIAMPNESLSLEWFYMTFHKSERDQFVTSGRRLVDETIESVMEYFESLYNIKKRNGKLKLQLKQRDRKKFEAQRGIVKHKYDDKVRNMADERRTSRSRNYRDDRNRNRGYKTSRDSDYKRNKFERKAPPEFSGKPCHIHGNKAKHTYEECHDNPKIRKSSSGNCDDNSNRKRNHDMHYHNKRYLSSQDESLDNHHTPEPSDDEGTKSSPSSKVGQRDEENYHVDTGKIPRKKRNVGVQRSASRKKDLRNGKPSHSTKHVTPSLLQDELDEDENLMEIEKKSGDVMNPFVFK
jgi:hypothetical protein